MRSPPAPNRFRHFSRDFRAVLKSRRCRSQHRESFLHASQASLLPTFGKSAGAVPGTTNAFLRRETSSRIPLGALALRISLRTLLGRAALHCIAHDVLRCSGLIKIQAAEIFADQPENHELYPGKKY